METCVIFQFAKRYITVLGKCWSNLMLILEKSPEIEGTLW